MLEILKETIRGAWRKCSQEITIIREIGWTTTDIRRLQRAASYASSVDSFGQTKFSLQQIMGATEFAVWLDDGQPSWPSPLAFAKRFLVAAATVLLGMLTLLLMFLNLFQSPLSLGSHLILGLLGAICLWFGQSSFRRLLVAIQLRGALNRPNSQGEPQ